MKIKITDISYEKIAALKPPPHLPPKKPSMFFRWLMKTVGAKDVKAAGCEYFEHGMERLRQDEPALILMNHSAFIDLEMAADYLYPRPFSVVCTSDGFVGKEWLMRSLGCIPTQKFVADALLVRDMKTAIKKLGCSVLMYPEASYSFDGRATTLPDTLGSLIRLLGAPVVTIMTHGAFLRDPLYNGLQVRDVKVTADITYFLSPDEIAAKSAEEINTSLRELFAFDNFAEQYERKIEVKEPFRADGLSRVLYKCPHCLTEGETEGKGVRLRCKSCGAEYELTELGKLRAVKGEAKFSHIPDWYAWERGCVADEIDNGKYRLDLPVDIAVMVDYKSIYRVGDGRLVHDCDGFHLEGCDGQIKYERGPLSCYGLYADYFWYEIGDMICIGDTDRLYYCFPKGRDVVAKTRMATEILYEKAKKDRLAARMERKSTVKV